MSASDTPRDGDAERLASAMEAMLSPSEDQFLEFARALGELLKQPCEGFNPILISVVVRLVAGIDARDAALREQGEQIEDLRADAGNDAGHIAALRSGMRQVYEIIGIDRGDDNWPEFLIRLREHVARLQSAQPAPDATAVVEAVRYFREHGDHGTECFRHADGCCCGRKAIIEALAAYDAAPPVDRAVGPTSAAAIAAHVGYLAHTKDDPDIYDKAVVAIDAGLTARAAAERAAIVAWLRDDPRPTEILNATEHGLSAVLMAVADAIERGEHAQPGGES